MSADNAQIIHVRAMNKRPEPVHTGTLSPWIAAMNPLTRFICALLIGIPLFFELDVMSASVAILVELAVAAAIGISPWKVARYTWFIWLAAIGSTTSVLLYGHDMTPPVYVEWGLIHITHGTVTLAVATGLRVIAIAMPSIVLAIGMDPTDLADALVQVMKLSPRFVYGALASMRMISLLFQDWQAIGRSRRSRGIGDGNAAARIAGQSFSLLVMSIRRATRLATAMEARGFGAPAARSYARISRMRRMDYIACLIALIVPSIAIGVAVLTGYWHFAFSA